MQLSDEAVAAFKTLYKTHFDIELSDDEARRLAMSLVRIVALTALPEESYKI